MADEKETTTAVAAMEPNLVEEIVEKIPKAELHIHLEGAIPIRTLLGLIKKYGTDPDGKLETEAQLREYFVFTSLADFVDHWIFMYSHLREATDYEQLAYDVLSDMATTQNIIHTEVFFSPAGQRDLPNPIPIPDCVEAVQRGSRRVTEETGLSVRWIIDYERHCPETQRMEQVELVEPYVDAGPSGLIGCGLGGPEIGFPPEPFADAFAASRRNGMRLTAHAGESAGPDSIWSAIRSLDVERIGHGVACAGDDQLVEHIVTHGLVLEICPTSNVCLGVAASLAEHPLPELYRRGVLCTVNTDDPTFFNCTLNGEYANLVTHLGFGWKEVKDLALNAIRASWLSDDDKVAFLERMETAWTALNDEYDLGIGQR